MLQQNQADRFVGISSVNISALPSLRQQYIITLKRILYVRVDFGLVCLIVGELPIIRAKCKAKLWIQRRTAATTKPELTRGSKGWLSG